MVINNKRNGYTLAEVLIALAIVGVLSVILITSLMHSQQNRDKVMALKTYMRLSTIVDTLINNEFVYPTTESADYPEFPFYNTATSYANWANKLGVTQNVADSSKLCRLIAQIGYHVDVGTRTDTTKDEDDNDVQTVRNACTNPNLTNEIPAYSNSLTPSFRTRDGMDFYVYTQKYPDDDHKDSVSYQTVVYADTNGNGKGNDCIFSATCPDPDVHKYLITADGKVYPIDGMSVYYSKNPKDTKKQTLTNAELTAISGMEISASDITKYANVKKVTTENSTPNLDSPKDILSNSDATITYAEATTPSKTYVSIGFNHTVKYDNIKETICTMAYSSICTQYLLNNTSVTIVYVYSGKDYTYTFSGYWPISSVFDYLDNSMPTLNFWGGIDGENTTTITTNDGDVNSYIKSVTGDDKLIKYLFGDQQFGEGYSYKESANAS